MSLPSYIKTEWKSRGHADLKFMSLHCKLCEEKQKKYSKKNIKTENIHIRECSHTKTIQCLLSTFNVWEYEEELEDLNPEETHITEDEHLPCLSNESKHDEEVLPPSINEETWKMWQHHWEDWKDVYINLSWVQRFKNLCSSEIIEWFNTYCNNYPQMLAFVSYCQNIELEKSEIINHLNSSDICIIDDPKNKKLINELYEEFSSKRFWVHFRLFLRDSNIEINEELKQFFLNHEIREDPPIITENLAENYDCKSTDNIESDNLCSENSEDFHTTSNRVPTISKKCDDTSESDPANSDPNEASTNNSQLPISTNDGISEEHASISESQVTNSEPNQTSSIDSLPEHSESHLENTETELLSPYDKESQSFSEQSPKQIVDSSLLKKDNDESHIIVTGSEVEVCKHNSSLMQNEKERQKCRGSKVKSRSGGVAWALKHVKRLGEEAKHLQSKNINDTFVFGTCESKLGETDSPLLKKDAADNLPPSDSAKINMKRKHEELELESKLLESSSSPSEDQKVMKPSPFTLRVIGGMMVHFQNVVHLFCNGVSKFIMGLTGLNLFQPRASWSSIFQFLIPKKFWTRGGIEEETSKECKMKSMEKNSLKYLKNFFKPTVRHIPDSPIISSGNVYLTQMAKCDNTRELKENLIKISHVDGSSQGSQSDLQSGLYVTYMTEDDIDYALEDVVELFSVDSKDEPIHRTLTLFDETGMPQDVIKVPVEGGKMRCMLEDDFKKESAENQKNKCEEDVLYSSNIHFDDEGNPVVLPFDYRHPQSREFLHSKINRVLRNYRLMRFSKGDVYNTPENIPKEIVKYWRQRFRLFLRYDEGIKLDYESWFSVTPEMIAAHQAERCACDIVVDAFCGAGGNAIQLAATCNSVIAIDIDPAKIEVARHNARIYGVEERIHFIQGDFFTLAPCLKADVVYLAPPWGGIEYLQEQTYDIFMLGGEMNGQKLFQAAKEITSNIAVYLPRNSNLLQIIELAYTDGKVDIEFSHISNKRKGLTAYFGDLVNFPSFEENI